MIEVKNLFVGYGDRALVSNLTIQFHPGEVLVVVGPNGCGKSTLLRSILGLQSILSGSVYYDGRDIRTLTAKQIAHAAAFLPQHRNVPNITAERMVLHGRFAYLSYPRQYQKRDREVALRVLEQVGALDLKDRYMSELSGGQRQKVYLAMALAQETNTIFMDEPTTFLDIRHQLETMNTIRDIASQGKAVAVVLHDLCLAMRTADWIAVLSEGGLEMLEPPEKIFTSGILPRIFGVSISRVNTAQGWQYYYDYGGRSKIGGGSS